MRLIGVTVVALLVALGVDVLLDVSRPGFFAAFGFIGCVVLIIGSKWLGSPLQRSESYYEGEDDGV